jgi:hypothetical protein
MLASSWISTSLGQVLRPLVQTFQIFFEMPLEQIGEPVYFQNWIRTKTKGATPFQKV